MNYGSPVCRCFTHPNLTMTYDFLLSFLFFSSNTTMLLSLIKVLTLCIAKIKTKEAGLCHEIVSTPCSEKGLGIAVASCSMGVGDWGSYTEVSFLGSVSHHQIFFFFVP